MHPIAKGVLVGGALIGATLISAIASAGSEKEKSAKLLQKIKNNLIVLFQDCKLPTSGLDELLAPETVEGISLAPEISQITCSFLSSDEDIELKLSVQYQSEEKEKETTIKSIVLWDEIPPSLADQILKSDTNGVSIQLYSDKNNNC
ncbi:MAG: hypothetical protein IJW23_02265 [Lentisphaeria bacterium]|nr:hypothetical protein [Lentisphaeria bacterium]